jgi:hypothetical protein
MAERLDPRVIFEMLAHQIPQDLKPNVLVVGSLAAAYHHRSQLHLGAVTTKDADVIIQPAGALKECKAIAERLLADGWRKRVDWKNFPPRPAPDGPLSAIRLSPPNSDAYFIELLGFPEQAQSEARKWVPIQLSDGWYALPCFRFLGLAAHGRLIAAEGLFYAAPRMMALANLLSHPSVGTERMSEPIGGRSLLRSAKDLGRVLALARFAAVEEIQGWSAAWEAALRATFPSEFQALAGRAGDGLRGPAGSAGRVGRCPPRGRCWTPGRLRCDRGGARRDSEAGHRACP